MGLERINFNLFGFETVKKIINNWKPRGCKSEKDYEKSLEKLLNEKFKEVRIFSQKQIGLYNVDLCVGEKYIIELKYNFENTNDHMRLMGQLVNYKLHWEEDNIFVVICGKTKPLLKKELKLHNKSEDYDLIFK